MKQVSMREFQRNAPTYLRELPITLTNYNIPIAVVSSLKKEHKEIIKIEASIEVSGYDMEEIAMQYKVPISFVIFQYEQLKNYCASSGKKYKDYKAALRSFVLRDIKSQGERRVQNGRPTVDARGLS